MWRGHIVFGRDAVGICVGVGVCVGMALSCLHDISRTGEQILSKLAGIYYWVMLRSLLVRLTFFFFSFSFQGHHQSGKAEGISILLDKMFKFNQGLMSIRIGMFVIIECSFWTGCEQMRKKKIWKHSPVSYGVPVQFDMTSRKPNVNLSNLLISSELFLRFKQFSMKIDVF